MNKLSIFSRARLNPFQLRTVAERRFADANALQKSGMNRHANGAMYLAGFVVECLLKAKLLEEHEWLRAPSDLHLRSEEDRRLYYLCYRSHALDEILEKLPRLRKRLEHADRGRNGILKRLQSVCAEWTIHARYSPRVADIRESAEFLQRIKELKEWLKY